MVSSGVFGASLVVVFIFIFPPLMLTLFSPLLDMMEQQELSSSCYECTQNGHFWCAQPREGNATEYECMKEPSLSYQCVGEGGWRPEECRDTPVCGLGRLYWNSDVCQYESVAIGSFVVTAILLLFHLFALFRVYFRRRVTYDEVEERDKADFNYCHQCGMQWVSVVRGPFLQETQFTAKILIVGKSDVDSLLSSTYDAEYYGERCPYRFVDDEDSVLGNGLKMADCPFHRHESVIVWFAMFGCFYCPFLFLSWFLDSHLSKLVVWAFGLAYFVIVAVCLYKVERSSVRYKELDSHVDLSNDVTSPTVVRFSAYLGIKDGEYVEQIGRVIYPHNATIHGLSFDGPSLQICLLLVLCSAAFDYGLLLLHSASLIRVLVSCVAVCVLSSAEVWIQVLLSSSESMAAIIPVLTTNSLSFVELTKGSVTIYRIPAPCDALFSPVTTTVEGGERRRLCVVTESDDFSFRLTVHTFPNLLHQMTFRDLEDWEREGGVTAGKFSNAHPIPALYTAGALPYFDFGNYSSFQELIQPWGWKSFPIHDPKLESWMIQDKSDLVSDLSFLLIFPIACMLIGFLFLVHRSDYPLLFFFPLCFIFAVLLFAALPLFKRVFVQIRKYFANRKQWTRCHVVDLPQLPSTEERGSFELSSIGLSD
jgi:hypothetical protein